MRKNFLGTTENLILQRNIPFDNVAIKEEIRIRMPPNKDNMKATLVTISILCRLIYMLKDRYCRKGPLIKVLF